MIEAVTRTTTISLEVLCDYEACTALAGPLYTQLSSGKYDLCSVLPIDQTLEEWRDDHRTARKRADQCERRGYRFAEIKRHKHVEDIFAINTSADERQGRPMSEAYRQRPNLPPLPDYTCRRHRISTYGVLKEDTLFSYLWLYRCGELALVSSILGHADHLDDFIMWLLVQGTIDRESACGGSMVYNRHDSGTDGLRWFKERLGFREREVRWMACPSSPLRSTPCRKEPVRTRQTRCPPAAPRSACSARRSRGTTTASTSRARTWSRRASTPTCRSSGS